jgi:undecaprenyl diphosphate synthase
MMKNNIRLSMIGDLNSLPQVCQTNLLDAMEITGKNTGLTVTLALSYSGKWDIEGALKSIVEKVVNNEIAKEDISQDLISAHLNTKGIPDPELLIRTSGELRISNFMLWQMAYTELFFTDVLWPDFKKEHLHEAILAYQKRERRFGKTGAQIKS